MEDHELTRKAIEELMKDMNECKEREIVPTERKKNPIGKPNKVFLGRTINNMLAHNKRESDRNLKKCERKLEELDEKQRKSKNRRSINSNDSIDSCDASYKNKTTTKFRRKKLRKKQKKLSSSSSSSTSSSSQSDSSSSAKTSKRKKYNRKKRRYGNASKVNYVQEEYNDYANENAIEYYVDPNIAYAAMTYIQINNMLHQHQMLQHQNVKKELEESVDIPSDLSISWHSSTESSINISLNSSSAEEDENGILTFKLSSDDDENISKTSKENQIDTKINKNKEVRPDRSESDRESIHSHISLESKDSQTSGFKQNDEICVLNSSCSDSEELEIVETITENIKN